MERIAFTMKLKPGYIAEYKRRHAELWPEMKQLLQENGISDYSIFLDEESLLLFAVHRQEETGISNLKEKEVLKRWWKYMAEIMDTHSDYSPVTHPLTLVFHLD
ncbi:L-rhamnose mutarotase [Sphingobacterium humi]|uniref:L-rhamnose mutarotase n=1 Tax=Sphingobacterium humi TaxID=1796905 RepID=A0A6N8KU64_9SPHI|nr:L-rhamnose mutarotase [Sphingobacterium humi]MVZ60596.1 L-rhamnose mutarotase [Sphingobacterium humi]